MESSSKDYEEPLLGDHSSVESPQQKQESEFNFIEPIGQDANQSSFDHSMVSSKRTQQKVVQSARSYDRLKINILPTPQNKLLNGPQTRVNQISAKLESVKIDFTTWDRLQLMAYQAAEPFLVGSIIATALQVSQLSSSIYLLVTLCLMTPTLLTASLSWVKAKQYSSIGLVCVACATLIYKSVLYAKFPNKPSDLQLQIWLGVYQGNPLKTFVTDSVVVVLCGMLIAVYWTHLYQLEAMQGMPRLKQKHQIAVKYHHPHIGNMEYQAFMLACLFFLLSSLCYQTLIPLLNMCVILGLVVVWAKNIEMSDLAKHRSIKAMCGLSILLILAQYIVQISWVQNAYPIEPRVADIIGINLLPLTLTQEIFTRVNMALMAFAITFTKLYFVCYTIHKDNQQRSGLTNPKLTPVYFPTIGLLLAAQSFCFVQAYMYHDFESIVSLCFVLIAFLPSTHFRTAQIAYWCFLPLMVLVYLFYYCININGALAWSNIDADVNKRARWQVFGFYSIKYPPLNFSALFLTLVVLCAFTRIAYSNEALADKIQRQEKKKVQDFTFFDQLFYLFLVNIDYFTLYCLTIVGLWQVDLYHLSIMAIFVWAALKPDSFKRYIVFVLLYTFAFTVARYVYSLLGPLGHTYGKIDILIGFKIYKHTDKVYFDSLPQIAQWVLMILLVLEYKRARFIGADAELRDQTVAQIKRSMRKNYPKFMSFAFGVEVFFIASCVFFAFLIQVVIVLWLRITALNLITLALLLLVMYKYISSGLVSLIRYWRTYQIWTALVLLTVFLYQFFISIPKAKTWYENLNPKTQALIYWAGYYPFETKYVFIYFLPYVTTFLLAILFMGYFQAKLEAEKKDLRKVFDADDQLPTPQLPNDKKRANQVKKRYEDMQYLLSYFIWKCKPAWTLFDITAKWFNMAIIVTVLAMALYFQIGLLSLVLIVIFAIQSCSLVNTRHNHCVKQGVDLNLIQSGENRECQSFVAEQEAKMRFEPVQLQPIWAEIIASNSQFAPLTSKRLRVTDEEILSILESEREVAKLIVCRSRGLYAYVYYTVVSLAIIVSYACMFFTLQYTTANGGTVKFIESQQTLNFALFCGFWSGVNNTGKETLQPTDFYISTNWPLFVLLLLVVCETMSVCWLENKFGTTPELVRLFEEITSDYLELFGQTSKVTQEATTDRPDSVSSINITIDEVDPVFEQSVLNQDGASQLQKLTNAKNAQKVIEAISTLLVELAVFFIWISSSFKMSILSYLMFLVILLRTYWKIDKSFLVYFMCLILVAQYISACASLSVYNSPAPFPPNLLNTTSLQSNPTYPNPYNTYLAIPVYYNLTSNFTTVADQPEPVVNTAMLEWTGIFVGSKRMNGMWMDLAAIVLLLAACCYYDNYLVPKCLKVVDSQKTVQLKAQMQAAGESIKFTYMKRLLYLCIGLVVIIFIIISTVFSQSLLGFVYFIFSMLLIQNYLGFYVQPEAPASQVYILKWLQVYLLVDLLVQMAFQYPFPLSSELATFLSNIGFDRIWQSSPTHLVFGVQTQMYSEVLTSNYTDLVTRGLTFFTVQLQLMILQSAGFTKFYDRILLDNMKDAGKLQWCYEVMRNNQTAKKVVGEAQYFGNIQAMLAHVKAIVKDREILNKPITSQQLHQSQQVLDVLVPDDLVLDTNTIDFANLFAIKLQEAIQKKLKNLPLLAQLYLYLADNYVISLIYYKEQKYTLDYLVEEYGKGRTCIETNFERRLKLKIEADLLKQMNEEYGLNPAWLDFYATYQRPQKVPKKESLFLSWLKLVYRAVGSNLHFLCYLVMLTCTITTGGWLYMFYPGAVFGYAMMVGGRPTKTFWLTVIYYTQVLIVVQFFLQLKFWTLSDSRSLITKFYYWNNLHNTGLVIIPRNNENSAVLLQYFWSEILVIVMVLIHVQIEAKSGILDVENQKSLETFDEAIDRYVRQILTSSGYQEYLELKSSLEEAPFKVSVKQKKVWNEFEDLQAVLTEFAETFEQPRQRSSSESVRQRERNPELKYEIDVELVKFGIVQPEAKLKEKQASFVSSVFWDNDYFNKLFPLRRQQKPGRDFYTSLLVLCILMFVFIFVLFNRMTGLNQTLTDTINTSFLSIPMILILMCLMLIMLFDRIFYTFHTRYKAPQEQPHSGADSDNRSQSSQQRVIEQMQTLGLEVNKKNLASPTYQTAFIHRLMPSNARNGFGRVTRFYYVWGLIILFHWFIFFYMTYQPSLCGISSPYSCNQLNKNASLLFFYIFVCLYLGFQAAQIQTGLPEMKKGLNDSYDKTSYYVYQVWLQIPLLFELRTIVDWTFTKSALDVFQYLKLAEVQSQLYIAKCMNQGYAAKELGSPISKFIRYATGFGLILVCMSVVMIPLILFSSLNIFGSTKNPVISGTLTFSIDITNNTQQSTKISLPLFTTNQIIDISELTDSEFSLLQFNSQANAQTNLFRPSQSQRIQFSKNSDSVWTITPPKLQILKEALLDSMFNQTQQVDAVFRTQLKRFVNTYPYSEQLVRIPLNATNQNFTQSLLNMINCENETAYADMQNNTQSILWLLTAQNYGTRIYNPQVTAGARLQYFCNATYNYTNYWSLQMQQAPPLNSSGLFLVDGGMGMIVFNQPVLPPSFSVFGTTVAVFFVSFLFLVSGNLRSALITQPNQIFITDSIKTEDLLMICQCTYIYRAQKNLENEEELYYLLIDIMRSPETLKSITGSSLKKKLD